MLLRNLAIKKLKETHTYTELAEITTLKVGNVKKICSTVKLSLLNNDEAQLIEWATMKHKRKDTSKIDTHTAILAKCLDNKQRNGLLNLLCVLEPSCINGSQTHRVIRSLLVECLMLLPDDRSNL